MSLLTAFSVEEWVPKTKIGRMVKEGKITSLDELFRKNYPITEPELVKVLLPDAEEKVLDVYIVQKQTDAGEKSRLVVVLGVGNKNGYLGIGAGKGREFPIAATIARKNAYKNIFPIKRGCGNAECMCGEPHSIPFKVTGKCGSVRVTLIPAPRGTGLIVPEHIRPIFELAGIHDIWLVSRGHTRTTRNFIMAVFNALKNIRKYEV